MSTAMTVTAGAAWGVGVLDVALGACDAADNTFLNDGNTILLVKNALTGAATVTVVARVPANPRSGNTAFNKTLIVVPDTKVGMAGPFPTEIFGSTVTIGWTISGGSLTNVTAIPVSLAKTPL